ncbi:MAG: hypothetical protein AAGJ70_12810 [Pseudomonadota bacterium]
MALGLAACSGGGGGGSTAPQPTAPAPTPAPTNAAPIIVIDLDTAAPDEGQPFVIDASGSTDADGDPLTFSVTQVSGPDATSVDDPNAVAGVFAFSSPEVDDDGVMTFEVTVSDGETSVVRTVEVPVRNDILEPATSAFVSGSLEVAVRNPFKTALSFPRGGAAAELVFVGITSEPDGTAAFAHSQIELDGAVAPLSSLSIDGVSFSSRSDIDPADFDRMFGNDFAFTFEDANTVRVLTDTGGEPASYEVSVTLDATAPCAVQSSLVFSTDVALLNAPELVVAERGAGLSYWRNGDTADTIGKFGEKVEVTPTGSFCEFEVVNIDPTGAQADIVAVDVDALSYAVFLELSDGSYLQLADEPLTINSSKSLTVVDFESFSFSGGLIFVLLLTDGEGGHILQVYEQNPRNPALFNAIDGFALAEEIVWTGPAPTDIGVVVANGQTHILVAVPESKSLRVYSSDVDEIAFSDVRFLDVGLGATEISAYSNAVADESGIMVLLPEQARIRTFLNAENTSTSAGAIGARPAGVRNAEILRPPG